MCTRLTLPMSSRSRAFRVYLRQQPAHLCIGMLEKMAIPADTRVVVMECPGNGGDARGPRHVWHTSREIDAIVAEFVERVGCGRPVDLIGYSLGGALAGRLLAGRSDLVRRTVLIAPGFLENTVPDFLELAHSAPRRVHGWETKDELAECFTKTTLGVHEDDMLSPFLIAGLVHQRRALGAGYYSRAFATFLTDPDIMCMPRVESAISKLAVKPLVIIGDRDVCIDPAKTTAFAERYQPRCPDRSPASFLASAPRY